MILNIEDNEDCVWQKKEKCNVSEIFIEHIHFVSLFYLLQNH